MEIVIASESTSAVTSTLITCLERPARSSPNKATPVGIPGETYSSSDCPLIIPAVQPRARTRNNTSYTAFTRAALLVAGVREYGVIDAHRPRMADEEFVEICARNVRHTARRKGPALAYCNALFHLSNRSGARAGCCRSLSRDAVKVLTMGLRGGLATYDGFRLGSPATQQGHVCTELCMCTSM